MSTQGKTIAKPTPGSYPVYYDKYIPLVKSEQIFDEYFREHIETMELVTSVDEETLRYRYAEGKWTIREIIQHVIDTERVLTYRALRFSRNDKTVLPGFDENLFAANVKADKRDINDLVRELSVVRASTVELFKSMEEEMFDRKGNANGVDVTPRAIMYFTLGHEIHHRNIIEERYLPK